MDNHATHRAPSGDWGKTWLTAAALLALALGGWEVLWRVRGHVPSVVANEALWAFQRARASPGNTEALALLGKSRMRLNFSTDTFREHFPQHPVIPLAVGGLSPVASLRNLAEDQRFRGRVLCSITAEDLRRERHAEQLEYVDFYRHRATWDTHLNVLLSRFVQSRCVFANPRVNSKTVVEGVLAAGHLPDPIFVVTHADGSKSGDFSGVDIEPYRREREAMMLRVYKSEPPPPPDQWLAEALEIIPLAERIEARGGKVAFVRMPTSYNHWKYDEQYYPKREYWDRFAARCGRVAIHFQDVPELRGFRCPDSSHLDQRDAPAFTIALCGELVRRGFLDPGERSSGRVATLRIDGSAGASPSQEVASGVSREWQASVAGRGDSDRPG